MHGQASHKGNHLGVRFQTVLHATVEGGTLKTTSDGSLDIRGADSLTLILGAATDYHQKDPAQPLNTDLLPTALDSVTTAAKREYRELLDEHVADHQRLFRRCQLDLGGWEASVRPTDERLAP